MGGQKIKSGYIKLNYHYLYIVKADQIAVVIFYCFFVVVYCQFNLFRIRNTGLLLNSMWKAVIHFRDSDWCNNCWPIKKIVTNNSLYKKIFFFSKMSGHNYVKPFQLSNHFNCMNWEGVYCMQNLLHWLLVGQLLVCPHTVCYDKVAERIISHLLCDWAVKYIKCRYARLFRTRGSLHDIVKCP